MDNKRFSRSYRGRSTSVLARQNPSRSGSSTRSNTIALGEKESAVVSFFRTIERSWSPLARKRSKQPTTSVSISSSLAPSSPTSSTPSSGPASRSSSSASADRTQVPSLNPQAPSAGLSSELPEKLSPGSQKAVPILVTPVQQSSTPVSTAHQTGIFPVSTSAPGSIDKGSLLSKLLPPEAPLEQSPSAEPLLLESPAAQLPLQLNLPLSLSATDLQPEKYSAWRQAFLSLSQEDRDLLDKCDDIQACLKEMKKAAEDKKKACDKERWTYTKKDGDPIVLRDITDKIINWIDRFVVIGDIAASSDPAHAALPWAGFRFLLKVVSADRNNQGAILVGLENLTSIVDRCAIYERLFLLVISTRYVSTECLEKKLVGLYAEILIFLSKCKRYYSRNTVARLATAVWAADFDSRMMDIEKKGDEVFKAAETADMEHNQVAWESQCQAQRELRGLLDSLSKPICRMDFRIADLYKGLTDRRRSKILTWISTIEYLGHHKRAREGRLSDVWLLERKEFIDWRKKSATSLLWLHGIPGSGKTKIVSGVIDTLITAKAAGSQEALAYFYFDRNEPDRCTPESALRAIVKQISSLEPGSELLGPIVKKYEQAEKENFSSGKLNLPECCDLIIKLLPSYSQSNIVIDALDECDKETRSDLISALKKIMESTSNLVKVFVSSRDDGDIVLRLEKLPNLRISAVDNSGDIRRFVETEITRCIEEEKLLGGDVSSELRAHVIDTLSEGADGMFMWVALQIKNLCDVDRVHLERDVREELSRLPKGLGETYSVILKKISAQSNDSRILAEKTLKWILCAQTPLSPTEMIRAISVEPDGNIITQPNLNEGTILRFCHNLVVWDRELDVLRFAHLSVREFLEGQDAFKITNAHSMAAIICLRLLCLPNQTYPGSHWTETIERYSAQYWHYHIWSCDKQSEISFLLKEFFRPSPGPSKAFIAWTLWMEHTMQYRFVWSDIEYSKITPLFTAIHYGILESVQYLVVFNTVDVNAAEIYSGLIPLHIASKSVWGTEVVRTLVDLGARVDCVDDHNQTALIVAVGGRHEPTVRLLLDKGADPNHSDMFGYTALFMAAKYASDSTVQLLLDRGADPNHANEGGDTALLMAARDGEASTVQLLLDKGADPNHANEGGDTALLMAARYGKDSTVQLLLDKGTDPNHSDVFGNTALLMAARDGEASTVQLLLSKGADPNHANEGGDTALLMAARYGKNSSVQLLLEKGADPNYSDVDRNTALLWAVKRGQEPTVQLLLDKGADPNHSDVNGNTVLLMAAQFERDSTVQLLLHKGADPNPSNGFRTTALLFVVKYGTESTVQLLLDKGAHINHLNNVGDTALLIAVLFGKKSIVQLLLERGAHFNHSNELGLTSLLLAEKLGSESIAQLVLEKGADPNPSDKKADTALFMAAQYGCDSTVQLLLERGADVNYADEHGSTALLLAVNFGRGSIVQLLLEKGADFNYSDKNGNTALLSAVENDEGLIVQLLLDKGADPSAENNHGETALSLARRHGHSDLAWFLYMFHVKTPAESLPTPITALPPAR